MTAITLQTTSPLRAQVEWRLAAVRNGVRDALAYRGDFLINCFSSALVPVAIQLILWYSIFHNSNTVTFGGMTYPELLAYTWTSILFSQVRGGDSDFELAEMIRIGTLNNYLLRPVGVIEFTFFRILGEKLITTAFCFVLGVCVLLYLKLSVLNLILAMSLALMGNLIHYLFGSALAAVAFYWENGFAILMVKNMAVSLLSGEVLPLSIVPAKYAWIWQSTPFYLYVYGPTQITLGKWDHAMWMHQMEIGFVWIIFFWLLIKLVWGISIKRYQGIGG
jgi:ABC-2 type transport system permease protein